MAACVGWLLSLLCRVPKRRGSIIGNNGFGGVENSVVKHGDPQTHLFKVKVTLWRRRRSAEGNALSLLIPPLWSRRGTGKKGGNLVKAAAAAAYYKGRIHREREKEEEEGCLAAAARS